VLRLQAFPESSRRGEADVTAAREGDEAFANGGTMSAPVSATLDGCPPWIAASADATVSRPHRASACLPDHRPAPVDAGPCLERRSRRRGACQAVGRAHWAQALRAAAAVLATGAVAVPAGAATYYVSPAGSDEAAGTTSAPFRTLDRLQRVALRPGDVVLLQSGATFTGSLQLDRAGTPAAPISVTSSGPARAIVDGRLAGRTLVDVEAAHVRVSHLDLRRAAHAPGRASDQAAIYLGRSTDVTLTDLAISGAVSAIFNGSQVASDVRISRVTATGLPAVPGSAVQIGNPGSTGWSVTDSTLAGFGDSCVIDVAGRSRFSRLTVRHCGYARLPYGTHGLYLKGPGAVLEDSRVSDVRPGAGSCVSPRNGAALRRNVLWSCSVGVGFFDDARGGGSQTLELTSNTIRATAISAIYVDTVGLSPDTAAPHRLVLALRGNRIDATSAAGGAISANGIAIRAPARGSAIAVQSARNTVTGRIRRDEALLAVFYNVARWPRGSTYRGAGNRYRDRSRGRATTFLVPGIRYPYGFRDLTTALRRVHTPLAGRELGSRIG
jgi:hypothetical protein